MPVVTRLTLPGRLLVLVRQQASETGMDRFLQGADYKAGGACRGRVACHLLK